MKHSHWEHGRLENSDLLILLKKKKRKQWCPVCFDADKLSCISCRFNYYFCSLGFKRPKERHIALVLEGFWWWQQINPGDVRLHPARHNASLSSPLPKKVDAWVVWRGWQQVCQLPGTNFLCGNIFPNCFTCLKSLGLFLMVAFSHCNDSFMFFLSMFPLSLAQH